MKPITLVCNIIITVLLSSILTTNAQAYLKKAQKVGSTVYFMNSYSYELTRYSLSTQRFLEPIQLPSVPKALHINSSGIYISQYSSTPGFYSDIIHMDLNGENEKTLLSHHKQILDIESLNDLLILSSNGYVQTVDQASGALIDEKNLNSFTNITADDKNHQLFMLNQSGSTWNIMQLPIDENGLLGTENVSSHPAASSYAYNTRMYVFPTTDRITDNFGDIYNSNDLSYDSSYGGRFDDLDFHYENSILLRNNTLYKYNQALKITGIYPLKNITAKRIFVRHNNIFAFSSNQQAVEIVAVSQIGLASPVTAMNPAGMSYTPDEVILDADKDTVYLLSKEHMNIFRWSVSQGKYLSSIPLRYTPSLMSYLPNHNRIYLAYDDYRISYIDLSNNSEQILFHVNNDITTLSSAGNFLLVRYTAGYASPVIGIFDENGRLRDSSNGYIQADTHTAWNPELNRYYYLSNSYPRGLAWQEVDQLTGKLGTKKNGPYHASSSWNDPIRISTNGLYVAVGNGRVLDAETLVEINSGLSTTYHDIAWLHNNVFTLSDISNSFTAVKRWRAFNTELEQKYEISGSPIAIKSLDDSLLFIYSHIGIPRFEKITYQAIDSDGDGYLDTAEEFPHLADEWKDTDKDRVGNNADEDDDNDGHNDDMDAFPLDETEWLDTDNDNIGNNTDTDDDNDGHNDSNDDFPLLDTEWLDTDGDGIGNNTDTDDDNDGLLDIDDVFPLSATETIDTDNDGIGNNTDRDDDNDGHLDINDDFPLDADEWLDTDNDGIGNNTDTDDDNDGYLDTEDEFPINPTEWLDTDGDGIGNNSDTDDDNDGHLDINDDFPLDANEWLDTDGDGISNAIDTDDDNDGYPDTEDALPLNKNEWLDTDGDGIGNNSDTDDDNDGHLDINDDYPLDPNEWLDGFTVSDIVFTDANLQACVTSEAKPGADVLSIEELFCSNQSITTINGIENFANLKSLYLSSNNIRDINPLKNLSKLETLSLSSNLIESISTLSSLTNLINLYLDSNQIEDLTPLNSLTQLTILGLTNNNLSSIAPLAHLTNLRKLGLGKNAIRDISPLTHLSQLTSVFLADNQISDLTPLSSSALAKLETLSLSGNSFSSVSALYGLSKLKNLHINGVSLDDMRRLSVLQSLNFIGLWDNNISNEDMPELVDILSMFNNLKSLSLSFNQISDISELSRLYRLEYLDLESNQIVNTNPLSTLRNLRSLYIENNRVSDVSGLNNLWQLEILWLLGNNISDLSPLSSLSSLRVLQLNDNNISNLNPLAGLLSLRELNLNENNISDLSPLATLNNLTFLYLDNNNISDINALSGLAYLWQLNLNHNNFINTSQLSTLSSLRNLQLKNNSISNVKPLESLTELKNLDLSENNEISCINLHSLAATLQNTDIIQPESCVEQPILGRIDSVDPDTGLLTGWTCIKDYPQSISIGIYLNGDISNGVLLDTGMADAVSGTAVANVCQSIGTHYRFSYTLPMNNQQYCGSTVHVYGLSPNGETSSLTNSGVYVIPDCLPDESHLLTPSNTQIDTSFLIGATSNNGKEYRTQFSHDDVIDVNASINIDSGSIGKNGYLFAVIIKNNSIFMLSENQTLIPWDLDINNLVAFTPLKTLKPQEKFKVFNDLHNEAGNYYVYIGYKLTDGELYYNLNPLIFTVN